MKAKKALGQNFLKNDTIIHKIVSLLCAKENDLIIEIGPGRGALTKELSNLPCKKICIEIDEDMHPYLDQLESDKLKVIYADILNTNLKDIIKEGKYNNLFIIGNLPYYITTPIIEKLIKESISAQKMVFMVQKEVGERLSSKPGHSNYGYMTLFTNYYYDVSYEFTVSKGEFVPIPKVDSAIISLNKKNKISNVNEEEFFMFLKKCFRFKRKTLKNNLKGYNQELISRILRENGYLETARPEEINEEVFIKLFEALTT